MSAESQTDPEPNTDSDANNHGATDESKPSPDGTTGGNEAGADNEVSRVFVLGLLAIGLLLFGLFAWAALTGRGSPL